MNAHGGQWAAQAVTFYAPAHWGVDSSEELLAWATSSPKVFWDSLLDQVAETGAARIELCFEPGDWKTLRAAYVDAPGVLAELARRDLALSGSYQGGGHRLEAALSDASLVSALVDEVREHARFIREVGGTLVLSGPPRRFPVTGSYDAPVPERAVDALAGILDLFGAAADDEGVRFGMHTEAYSLVARHDDVSSVMQRTDPSLVSLCVDAGHVTLDGGNPARMIREQSARVRAVHWKDCAGPRSWLPDDGEVSHELMMEQFRTPGDGAVDWDAVTDALAHIGFDGSIAAESDLAADPVAETRTIFDRFHAPTAEATA